MLPTRLILIASLATTSAAFAQTPARPLPESRAVPTTASIKLDGKLDESAWSAAPATTDFTQINPDEGKPSSERTEVRVLFDGDALYIGVRAFDRGPVTARLGRRDMPLGDSDWFGVMIDSYHDHRTAFGFDVNPAGVRRDEIKTITRDDNSWDAVWEVATSIDSAGWVAEYRIPFSQLRFARESQVWGIQFERIIGRRNEYMVSTFIPKSETGGVPAYGHLVGVTDVLPGGRLELLPYTLARAEFIEPGQNPFRTRHEYGNAMGLDLRYRVASNVTLNATINPDFGQVEVDPAIVNLGVYETFFDEKRPFFLEGNEIFDFGLGNTSGGRLFYSRRIGRPPSLFAPTSRFDAPTATTILGAAKLSGKVKGWSIGTLASLTDREQAKYLDAADAEKFSPVEPRSAYFVSRARRELRGGQSLVGGVVTVVHRDLADSLLKANYRSDALTAGVDFLHQWNRRSWSLRGDAEVSRVAGSTASLIGVQRAGHHYFQRPDAEHLAVDSNATSLVGYSTSANLTKQAGLHWRGDLAGARTSPQYEVNDLGFAQRTDRRDVQLSVTYNENTPGKTWRSWSTNWNIRSEHNYANEPILTVGRFTYTLYTLGYFTIHGNVAQQFRSFDDRLTRGGPIAVRPANSTAFVFLSTDGRKPITMDWQFNAAKGEEQGMWSASAQTTIGIKTSSRWNLKVGPRFARGATPAQFVTRQTDASYTPTYGVRYVFAPINQTELGLETRFNYTFTPTLSLESYVQPLISTGDYGDAKQLEAARTYDFIPYASTIPNLDFNLRSLRGNAVVRWEWRPGSTMFVAWQQSRRHQGALGDFAFNRDQQALFAARPDNIFLVKMNWWLSR